MSINQLLIVLSVVSLVFFVYMSAKQLSRPDRVLRVNQIVIPVWTWVFGVLISSLLTILPILNFAGLLDLFPAKLIVLIYILILSVLTVCAFVVYLVQFSRPFDNLTVREKLTRSVIAGFAANFGFSSLLSILWVSLDNSAASNVNGLICLLIPAQIITSIGAYSKLGWQKKFEENARTFYENHTSKNKKDSLGR